MRAKERHDLHRNWLAERLGQWNERIKPYSNVIFIAILAVAVGIAAMAYWVQQSRAEQAMAWVAFYGAASTQNVSELEDVAARYSGNVAQCAALSVADLYLARGCQQLFDNKSLAGDDLRKAVEHYRQVQDESREPMLLAQASFGLARAYEALAGTGQSQGELQKAIETYQQVVERWPNGPYAEQAARRLEDLQQHETKAFYDQFAQFDPQPARSEMSGLPGGPLPFEMGSLSEDVPLPGPTESVTPKRTEEPQPPSDGGDLPKPDEAGPVGAQPPEPAGPQPTPPAEPPAGPEMPAQPDEPAPQGPSEPEPAPDASQPEPSPPSQPAPAEKTPDQPVPPAEPAPDPQPSPPAAPSEANP